MQRDPEALLRASIKGLAIGDAIGRLVFMPEREAIDALTVSDEPYMFTDDTRMALAIGRVLLEHGQIDQDALALEFARDFQEQPERGYGAVAHFILHQIATGEHWSDATTLVYSGQGSKGNGGAMRSAPLGAFFADDTTLILDEAARSARVTHAHPEGIIGAQAVALMTGHLLHEPLADARTALEHVEALLPDSEIKAGIRAAIELGPTSPIEAAAALGSGEKILAEDTVPIALWLAAHFHQDFRASMQAAFDSFNGDSDTDTVCAILGGIIAPVCADTIPNAWVASCETWSL